MSSPLTRPWPADMAHGRQVTPIKLFRNASVSKTFTALAVMQVVENGAPFREIAEAIGRQLNPRVVSVAANTARDHFNFLAGQFSVDQGRSCSNSDRVPDQDDGAGE